MRLKSTYVVGELELIAQEKGQIFVRMKNCGPRVKVYDGDRELESSFAMKIYGEFSQQQLTLSHSLMSFAEGDKVKLIRRFDGEEDDKFTLKNLSLLSKKLGGLDDLKPKPEDKVFSVDVKGRLEYLAWNRTMVAIRMKCYKRIYVSFGANQEMFKQSEDFEKGIFVEIPRTSLCTDIGVETLAAYKKGDEVCLSHIVEDSTSFDFDNLTLSVCHAKPNYKSPWSL